MLLLFLLAPHPQLLSLGPPMSVTAKGTSGASAGEVHFRALIEKSPDAVVLFGADATVRYATPSSVRQALAVAHRAERPVALLLTDVVTPGEVGRVRAERAANPNLRVVFVSGYTDDAVVRHGVASDRMTFRPNPFTRAAPAQNVREVLDARAPDGGDGAGHN